MKKLSLAPRLLQKWTWPIAQTVLTLHLGLMSITSLEASPLSYPSARKQFENGDIPGAVNSLQRLLYPTSKVPKKYEDDARALLGIGLYLKGQKPKSEREFRIVLSKNPSAVLRAQDVLDPGVSSFFEAIRKQASVLKSKPQPSAKTPVASRGAQSQTGILIQTNASRATVFASGIFIGTPGQTILLAPGKHDISISAEGFRDVSKSFILKSGQVLSFKVTLQKQGEDAPKIAAASGGKRKNDVFDPETSKAASSKKKAGLDYNEELPSPKRKPGPDLASEFYRDLEGGGAQAPRPAYSASPPRSYPGYPQPQVVQPAPAQTFVDPNTGAVYQAVPQPLYSPPPPVYSPPPPVYAPYPVQQQPYPTQGQNYQSSEGSEPIEFDEYGPLPQRSPSPKRPSKPENPSIVFALLPLGSGQFQNEHNGKGFLFAGVQVGGVLWALYQYKLESDFNAADSKGGVAQEPDYAAKAEAYRKGVRLNQALGWGLFAAAWGGSILDGIYYMKSPSKKTAAHLSENMFTQEANITTWNLSPHTSFTGEIGIDIKVNF